MIFNYLKIAYRNLAKYKFISFINLFGLTVGMACCLLILTYIFNELSYDRFHKKANNVYRVTRTFFSEQGVPNLQLGTIAPPFGPLLKNDFGEIKKIARLLPNGTTPLRYEEKLFNETDVYWGDEFVFDIFTFHTLKGNPSLALRDPYSVMLSEKVAEKYFGSEDPMNKVIRLQNQFNFKVTGVFKSLPPNSHIHPEVILSFNTLKDTAIYGEEQLRTNWGNNSFFTYIELPDNYNPKSMIDRFPAFIDKHMIEEGSTVKPSSWTSLSIQKLTDIHLRSHLDFEAEENGDIRRIYIFGAIALFILLIACINYMNLSTARSTLRAREIGIRKVVGARRSEIIAQFLSESVLLSWISILLAFLLTYTALPWLNELSGQQLSLRPLLQWQVLVVLALVPFVVGLLSGSYPALLMSGFQPVKVLKGLFKVKEGNISFRKVLVITQFSISVILIISTVVVFSQLRFMQKKSLGFNKEHIVTLPYYGALTSQFESFRSELMNQNLILNASRSSRIPSGRLLDAQGASLVVNDSEVPVKADIKMLRSDHYFMNTFGVKVLHGRNFSKEFGTDTASFVINEAAAKALLIKNPADAPGTLFRYGGINGKIIGVIQDFHFESMHERIVPLVFLLPPPASGAYSRISVKVAGHDIPAALGHIEKTWKKFLPDLPFEYTFLEENFNRLYEAEQRQGTIFSVFACIAIFIACLGLLGLTAFTISQRIKEIGIRKVLGASTSSIVSLLSRDFLLLVGISAIIAFPVAYLAMNNWLNDFAYRISVPWWSFVLAAVVAALIALLTIGIQAIKASLSNPVKSLRSE